MPILMQMKWDGITPEQYDKTREIVNMDADTPKGLISHAACFRDNAIYVNDIWETAEDFNNFAQTRLMNASAEAGMNGEPHVEIYPAHAILVPNMQEME